tara:strand:+ start:280 stop:483 length:204 start_codon:yes stop_codon:yes gene_type:complete
MQNIGPVTFAQLVNRFGTPGARAGGNANIAPTIDAVEDEIAAAGRYGAHRRQLRSRLSRPPARPRPH